MVVVERETLEPEDEVGPGGGEVAGLPRVARQVVHLYSSVQCSTGPRQDWPPPVGRARRAPPARPRPSLRGRSGGAPGPVQCCVQYGREEWEHLAPDQLVRPVPDRQLEPRLHPAPVQHRRHVVVVNLHTKVCPTDS